MSFHKNHLFDFSYFFILMKMDKKENKFGNTFGNTFYLTFHMKNWQNPSKSDQILTQNRAI